MSHQPLLIHVRPRCDAAAHCGAPSIEDPRIYVPTLPYLICAALRYPKPYPYVCTDSTELGAIRKQTVTQPT